MKKLILLLALIVVATVSMAANRTGYIKPGLTTLTIPMTFNTSDSIITSATYTITITNPQKYLQNQVFTTTITTVSGSPSVAVTAYGKVNSGDFWVQIGSPVTWTTSGNNPITISSTTPNNYNYLKVAYVASGATQHTKVSSFDVKTSNAFDIPANSGTLTIGRATTGTVTITSKDDDANAALTVAAGGTGALTLGDSGSTTAITSSDWAIDATGVATGLGAITSNGLITGTAGATLSGAAVNLNASSNFAINVGTGSTNAAVTIGGGSNTVAVNSSAWGISTAGVMSGLTISNASPVIWAKGGSTVLATSGTDAAFTNGGRFWVEVDIPYNVTLTGLAVLIGSVGGTDSLVVQLCNSAGVQVATSRAVGTAAVLVGTAAQFQSVAFTATYAAAAGKYFACIQSNGTTAKFRAYPIPGSKFIANTAVGTWGTKADITPGTSFVADKGPIVMTY